MIGLIAGRRLGRRLGMRACASWRVAGGSGDKAEEGGGGPAGFGVGGAHDEVGEGVGRG